MRFHASKPTRKYMYACREPVEGKEEIERQFRLILDYRRALVALEQRRRDEIKAVRHGMYPDYQAMDDEHFALNEQIREWEEASKAERKRSRKRQASEELRTQLKTAKERRKILSDGLKEMRTSMAANRRYKAAEAAVNNSHKVRRKLAYKDAGDAGLYWGNRSVVVKEIQGSLSRRELRAPWMSTMKVSVQFQKGSLPVLFYGNKTTKAKIHPLPEGTWGSRLSNSGRNKHMLWVRIGSAADKKPIWAKLPVCMSRDIPADSKIQWMHILRKRVGTRYVWQVAVDLVRDNWDDPLAAKTGHVGVDVGWRLIDDRLRVAMWADDQGRSGEISIPANRIGQLTRHKEFKAQRDINFDKIKDQFADWLAAQREGHEVSPLPPWLDEHTLNLRQWRSQARLASVVVYWRQPSHRFEGDAEIFTAMEGWRKHDKHLAEVEAGIRRNLHAWRSDFYWNVVKDFRRTYATVGVENMNLLKMKKRQKVNKDEEESPAATIQGEMRDLAAVGTLLARLKSTMTHVVLVDPKWTTKRCNNCKVVNDFDAATCLEHTCTGCGQRFDQDLNAAKNLLEVAMDPPAPESQPEEGAEESADEAA